MQQAMAEGRVTSRQLVEQSLTRIALYEDQLNAIITVNRRALEDAEARDRERAGGTVRGPLHGVPIALKDNIHTTDMPTTGGALAFAGLIPPYEATITRQLREAGAVILAKTQMTELANWVTVGMPGNYNSLNGYGFNPYDPRRDPRRPVADGRPALATGGSSSGVGTAVSFWAANVGTETSGSILNPSNQTMLVGIKPTVGRVSRYGIIPITADQDTAGPMARSVADAAVLLGALESPSRDPNDPPASMGPAAPDAPGACVPPPGRDYTRFLDRAALKGARIGVPRAFFYEGATLPGAPGLRGGLAADQHAAMEDAIAVLKREGAVVVDPADIPSVVEEDRERNFVSWDVCRGYENRKGRDGGCSVVFKYGLKRDFNAWLASLGPAAPVRTLAELRRWNLDHSAAGTLKYAQENLDVSDEMDVERDRARYQTDRRKDLFVSGAHGIDAALKTHRLDALLFPGAAGAAIAARSGYPSVIVPFALVANAPTPPFPTDFTARPAPFGVTFTASACSEPRLIALAYAFEQATRRRTAPPLFP
ncbi:MAG: amidase [Acidobacteria bacterium]|nr:amidase [Acidobacteriota bacterium]